MPIPVILDTDIGGDIDDTWALAFLLRCPELDLRLVVTDTADTEYRARIAARLIETAGRTDIPVAAGIPQDSDGPRQRQWKWAEGYDLARYPGGFRHDGVRALLDTVDASPEPVTLVAIGPAPNLREALRLRPNLAPRCRFVGMFGSLAFANDGVPGRIAEWNVVCDIPAAKAVFGAPWLTRTITPLDTCGRVRLSGANYRRVMDCPDPLARAVADNYRMWAALAERDESAVRSSILYDTVAVYLAFADGLLAMEDLPLRVTDEGMTVPAEGAPVWRCATAWRDLAAFETLLADRLAGPAS